MRCAFVGDHKTKVQNKNQRPSLIIMVFIALRNFKIKSIQFFGHYDRIWSIRIYTECCETCWRGGPRPALQFKKKSVRIGQFKVLDEGSRMLYLPIIDHFRTYPVIWSIRIWLERCQTWWRCGPGPAPRPVKNSFHSDNFKHETRGIVCYKQSSTTVRFYIFAHSSAQNRDNRTE